MANNITKSTTTDPEVKATTVYERLDDPDFPGTIEDDLDGLTIDQMAAYFGDLDPAEFL